jgi:hypothetical protein
MKKSPLIVLLALGILSGCASHWEGPIRPYEDREFNTQADTAISFDLDVEGRPLSRNLDPKAVEKIYSIQCENISVCRTYIDAEVQGNRVFIIPLKPGETEIQVVAQHPSLMDERRLNWPLKIANDDQPDIGVGLQILEENFQPTLLRHKDQKHSYLCQSELPEEFVDTLRLKTIEVEEDSDEDEPKRLILGCVVPGPYPHTNKKLFFDYTESNLNDPTFDDFPLVVCLSLGKNREVLGYRPIYRDGISPRYQAKKHVGEAEEVCLRE